MCGRYASSRTAEDLIEEFNVAERVLGADLEPDYNVAPTKEVYAVLERPVDKADPTGTARRQLRVLTWGLVPSWAKDPAIGSRMINARMETVAEKPAFRRAFAARRCLLPADGYFEWYTAGARRGRERTVGGGPAKPKPVKQPFFIRPADHGVLAMAGLYEIWRDPTRPDDDPERFRWTCTVITTEATDDVGRVHDRMPLMVQPGDRAAWLSPATPAGALLDLLVPAAPGALEAYPVSTRVGNVRHNDASLLDPLAPEESLV